MPVDHIFSTAISSVLGVYCVMAMGFVAMRREWITRAAQQQFLFVTVNVFLPCFIFDRVVHSTAFADPRNLFLPPLCGFLVVLMGVLVAQATANILPGRITGLYTKKERGTFAGCVGVVNYGFVPIPLVAVMFPGDDSLMSVLMVQNLGTEFAVWTIAIYAFTGHAGKAFLKRAVNVPTCTIVVAVLLNLYSQSDAFPAAAAQLLPCLQFAQLAISLLGAIAIPLSLFLVGCTIANYLDFHILRHDWHQAARIAFWSCLIRLALMPVLMLGALYLFPGVGSMEMNYVIVIHAAMASAVFPIVLTEIYGGDPKIALYTVLSNSAVAIITTPLWIQFGFTLLQ